MTDERGIPQFMVRKKVLDIFGEGRVVVGFVVRGRAVVAQVDGVDGPAEGAGEGAARRVSSAQ